MTSLVAHIHFAYIVAYSGCETLRYFAVIMFDGDEIAYTEESSSIESGSENTKLSYPIIFFTSYAL